MDMSELKIIRMGHPLLREKAKPLSKEEIHSEEIKNLIEDMYETMIAAQGIGLAAPQVGSSIQLAIVGSPEASNRYDRMVADIPTLIIFNPKIKVLNPDPQGFWEGCLSVPGLRGYVERSSKIEVEFLNSKAQKEVIIVEGFHATVFQHEIDHLNGILYIDRIKDPTKLSYLEEFTEFYGDQDQMEQ